MSRVYLDHNATSPLRREARGALLDALAAGPGNPGSVHREGHRARMAVETARARVAALVGAHPDEIVLTSGGTEANNLALFGAAGPSVVPGRRRVVTSAIEHPSVLAAADDLAERGFEVVRVAPGRDGVVPASAVLEAAEPGTAIVSLMLANNEIGTLQPVPEVGAALRRRGIMLHADAAQAAGKVPVDVASLSVDLLSLAGHKFGAPQGTGALYVRRGVTLRPHLRGGGQEHNRRPGTENVAALAGLGAAAEAARGDAAAAGPRLLALRDRLEEDVLRRFPGSRVNGGGAPRVPNTTSLAFPGLTGEALVIGLDLEGIAVSAGSACSAGTLRASHVLSAMGLREEAGCSIRVSLGPSNTEEDVAAFVAALARVLLRARVAAGAAAEVRR